MKFFIEETVEYIIQCVPLATEPGIFFNNSNTNEDIATKFEQEYVRCVRMKRNVSVVCVCSAPNCCDTEQRSASNFVAISYRA